MILLFQAQLWSLASLKFPGHGTFSLLTIFPVSGILFSNPLYLFTFPLVFKISVYTHDVLSEASSNKVGLDSLLELVALGVPNQPMSYAFFSEN